MKQKKFIQHNESKLIQVSNEENVTKLELVSPGIYDLNIRESMFGRTAALSPTTIRGGLIKLDKDPYLGIARQIVKFYSKETREIYADLQIKHFMGALFYGAPGSGKTCFVETICDSLIHIYNAIVIKISPTDLGILELIKDIYRNSEDQLIVLALDELDKFTGVGNYEFLNFLDGHSTPNNVLLLGTTNSITDFPNNLINRKSRFSIVSEINYAPNEVVLKYIKSIVPDKYKDRVNIPELCQILESRKIKLDEIKNIVLQIIANKSTSLEAVEFITKPITHEYDNRKSPW